MYSKPLVSAAPPDCPGASLKKRGPYVERDLGFLNYYVSCKCVPTRQETNSSSSLTKTRDRLRRD